MARRVRPRASRSRSLALAALLLGGCASHAEEDAAAPADSSEDGGVVSKESCTSRCQTRTSECNFSKEQGKQLCAKLCKDDLTSAALDCMDDQPCSANEPTLKKCSDAR